jgi:L-iditol 2-dehydrogenase
LRALVLHGPGSYRVENDWPEPEVKPGWALVRVAYAGICGSDLPRFVSTGSYHHPMILGHEFTGSVVRPAPGSTRFVGGERVAILPIIPCGECAGCRQNQPFHCTHYQFLGSRNDGGFAEYCLVPETNLFPLPAGIDARFGAFIEPLAVGLHVARRSGFQAGQSALVFGAGSIGLLVAAWLRVFGARRVVIAELRPESARIAHEAGFAEVVNPADGGLDGLPLFDHTFEAAGAGPALLAAIARTHDLGTLTVVGRDTRDTTIPLKAFEMLMRREIDLRGCWGYNLLGDEAFLLEMLGQERFPLACLITQQISLDQAPAMIEAMAGRTLHFCKVLIDMEKA